MSLSEAQYYQAKTFLRQLTDAHKTLEYFAILL